MSGPSARASGVLVPANKAHGHGKFRHVDGSSYEGQWEEDMQTGRGVVSRPASPRSNLTWIQLTF